MNKIMSVSHVLTVAVLGMLLSVHAQGEALKSPDGKVMVHFNVQDANGASGCLFWRVDYQGKPVLTDSRLGFSLADQPALDQGFKVTEVTRDSHDSTWQPVYGERSTVRDHYNELVVDLRERRKPKRMLRVTFRAYDEGAAVCYTFPEQPNLNTFTIAKERTQFRFMADHKTYPVYSAQGMYEATTLSQVKKNCERPLPLVIPDGPVVAIGEARLVDYARMRLSPLRGSAHTLVSQLTGKVEVTAPYTTPWRFVMIGDTPGQLLEHNDLMLNLNDPCAIEDPSWIKPGKVIREVTLTTAGGMACVDFAAANGIQYVEYDAGWYGHEHDEKADARTVMVDPKRSKGPLDLQAVIDYANSKGIGILVYVNRRHLERQLDEILPLYQRWGIKGIKYGFVQVGSQEWTTWLHEAIRKAAKYEMMVDVHDEYRPTGYSRTYPNFMTQEGIRGNECMPPPENNLILPFSRFLCGAGDYTVCWYTTRIQTTHAHQLGALVTYFSPLQFVFWYDKPDMFQGEPGTDFFKHVPVVWDDTRVLHGAIGEYITMARRSGDDWYVGSMNAVERRELKIPLTFLEAGKAYTAKIYEDAKPEGGDPFAVAVREMAVDSSMVIKADMAANGGHAMRIVPAE